MLRKGHFKNEVNYDITWQWGQETLLPIDYYSMNIYFVNPECMGASVREETFEKQW